MQPLLSIVIPTRNRATTAFACATAALRMIGDDLEIVVRDCSDTAELADQIETIDDSRLVYQRGAPVSMTDNWNAAMLLTSGKYIIYIGDDDGFMPWGLETLRELDSTETVHCLASEPLSIVYRWPDFSVEADRGLLAFERFPRKPVVKKLSSRAALKAYLDWEDFAPPLPGVYHRIASRELMDRIKALTGEYFKSLAPDIFTYFITAGLLTEYHVVHPPVSLAGSCGTSNSSRTKKHASQARLHLMEYGEDAMAGYEIGSTCGIDGWCADLIGHALAYDEDQDMRRRFKYAYASLVCGIGACKAPRRFFEIFFITLQGHVLKSENVATKVRGTMNFFRGMVRFTLHHIQFKLQKFGVYKSAYNKNLYSFQPIADISDAIDKVEQTTLAMR